MLDRTPSAAQKSGEAQETDARVRWVSAAVSMVQVLPFHSSVRVWGVRCLRAHRDQ